MSLPLTNNFETAIADETAITVVNSADGAAGSAFDDLLTGGASTIVYDTARAAHGTLSARMTQDVANGCFLTWSTSVGTPTTVYGRLYIYRTAAPSAGGQWLIHFQLTGTTAAVIIWDDSSQHLRFYDSTLGSLVETTNTVPLNEWVRIEWKLVCSATVGICEMKMFHADSASAIETKTLTSANTLTGVNEINFGQFAGAATGSAWWLDDLVVNSTGYPGPAAVAASTSTGGIMMLGVG